MENVITHNKPPRYINILISFVSVLIAGFYILSAIGWFAATYMMSLGALGADATQFIQSLNIVDKLIRFAQVILIIVASITLILRRRITLKLMLISILLSLVSFLVLFKWSISFLGGISGITILLFVSGYSYWLDKRGYLH
jgi:hypothetical protein